MTLDSIERRGYVEGGTMRRLIGSILLLGLTLLAASPVAAEGVVIGDAQISSTTIDMHDRLPTVTVTVTCLGDSDFVRIRLTLMERMSGATSSSQQTTATACVAGTTVAAALVFGPQEGSFRPGRAEIEGFVAANNVGLLDEFVPVPLTDVLLRPQ